MTNVGAPEHVTIEVDGQPVVCAPGRSLLNELLRNNLAVETACGGNAVCHLCRVTILNRDELLPPSAKEKRALGNVLIARGMRLSCQVLVVQGLRVKRPVVETKQQRRQRIGAARKKKQSK